MPSPKNVSKQVPATTIQATTNPLVSPQQSANVPAPIANMQPNGAVTLSPISPSHPTLGKGFNSEIVEDTVSSTGKKGRAKGTGMIVELVANIMAIKNDPAKHGKSLRVGQWASAQSATTMRQKLKKEYHQLVDGMELLIGSAQVPDTNGNMVEGSKMVVKYGIPRAENQG